MDIRNLTLMGVAPFKSKLRVRVKPLALTSLSELLHRGPWSIFHRCRTKANWWPDPGHPQCC